ncbi:MAG: right-handed parallel beta-helix repeat-containing protein [Planctomycetota bacterium]|jgi:hypothetical protein
MKHFERVCFFVCVLLFCGNLVFADTIYVKEGSSGTGGSWAEAYGDLQEAVGAAGSGKQIWVAAGTYKPDPCGLSNPREASFQMKNEVAIYGGFANSGNPVWDDRDPNIYQTKLSGDLNDDDVAGDLNTNRTDNCYHVFYHTSSLNLNETAVLDGFVISGGHADGSSGHDRGGGMYNDNASPTVVNCIFSENYADYWDSGMSNINHSSPTVAHCSFLDNYLTGLHNEEYCSPKVTNCTFSHKNGKGMANYNYSSPTVTDCNFSNNSKGGMYNYNNCSPTVTGCTFSNNAADSGGGGISNNNYSSPMVINCTFSQNSAGFNGGGMYNSVACAPTVFNCTFSENASFNHGGGMYNTNESSPIVTHCSFIANTAYSDSSYSYGGGMYISNDSVSTVLNCAFIGNSSVHYKGGGIYNEGLLTVTNCSFAGNSANTEGGGMYNYNCSPMVTNCIFWGNLATNAGEEIYNNDPVNNKPIISYSDIAGCGGSDVGWSSDIGTDGGGNIDADPCFVDVNGPDDISGTADDDLRLGAGSPCVDAGNNFKTIGEALDLDKHFRFVDDPAAPDTGRSVITGHPIIDLGAYERLSFTQIAGDLNSDGIVNLLDWAIFSQHWLEDVR